MKPSTKCPHCGAVLATDMLGGQCLSCLLQLGLNPPHPDPEATLREESDQTEKADGRIGHYRLLKRIGEGGFGIVFLAQQEEPVRRQIALKVIKPGMDTREVIARFEAERQALAVMDHPGIAKVFDGGTTAAGRPYFVMEFVDGVRITDYCDANGLSLNERLELFIPVCQAVHHAHEKGIIHRDLKPSNILVTEQDGHPVPKVIDFGIAKAALGQRLTTQSLHTALQQFAGTPAYMSPEQAGLGGGDVDSRSDIYSLGMLLYELLISHPAFESEQLVEVAIDEVFRTIRTKEPRRPSTQLSTLTKERQTGIAQNRQTEPVKLHQLLRGDLDWVVMKALEKDRNRRYETAIGLAMDIQRHLGHEPVLARPPDPLYRLNRFIRRKQWGLTALAAVVVALLVGFGLSNWLKGGPQARTPTRNRTAARSNTTATLLSAPPATNLPHAYRVVDLGDLPGVDIYSYAFRINDLGQVIGETSNSSTNIQSAAFIWDQESGVSDMGKIDGDSTIMSGINNAGVVVGCSYWSGGGEFHACSWDSTNGIRWLGPGVVAGYPYYNARFINDRGAIAFENWSHRGPPGALYLLSGGATIGVEELYPRGRTVCGGLNNSNVMVGHCSPSTNTAVLAAFIWSPTTGMVGLGTLPGYSNSVATGINDSSQVAGYCSGPEQSKVPFFWSATTGMRQLDSSKIGGSNAPPSQISAGGIVIAPCQIDGTNHAVAWAPGRDAVDLNTLVPNLDGWALLQDAKGMNSSGMIVGSGLRTNGATHAFVLYPLEVPRNSR